MKWNRLLAAAGVLLILSIYVIAFISAFSNHPDAKSRLLAAIYSSVIIPVFIYAVRQAVRFFRQNHDEPDS